MPLDLKTSITLDFSCSGNVANKVVLGGSLNDIKKTKPRKITNKVIITGIDLWTAGSFENFLIFSKELLIFDNIP
jgi:hypothetical protein